MTINKYRQRSPNRNTLKKKYLKPFWFLFGFIFGFVLPLLSLASSTITPNIAPPNISYYKDESKNLTAQDIATRQDLKPTSANTSLGFSNANIWMKIEVKAPTSNAGPTYLSLWPPRLENAKLYQLPSDDQGVIEEIIQDKEYLNNGNVFYDSFKSNIFDLKETNQPTTYLLKIQSDFSLVTKIDVFNQTKLNEIRTNTGFVIGSITYGLIPFLIIFAFFSVTNRSGVYFSYLINIVGLTFFYLASIGLDIAKLLQIEGLSLDHQVAFFAIISPLTTYFFLTYLSVLLGAPDEKLKEVRWCIKILFILSFSYFLFNKQLVSISFLTINLFLSAYTTFVVYKDFQKRNLTHWLLLFIFVVINLAAVNIFVSLLGIKQSSSDVFFTQTLRIALVPFILILLVTHHEETKNQNLIALETERRSAEKAKTLEVERRRTYENFVTMLLHEIKTPLSIIQIAAGSLSRHIEPSSAENNRLENIKKSVVEINQVFNKCMQVVDLENDSLHIDESEFRITLLIEDLRRSLESERIQFDLQCEDKIFTDYVILKTILSNLLTNALKYSAHESTVHLAIARSLLSDKDISFNVINKPSDVGQPEMDKVFQRFYRAESAKKFAGSGQGLWLSQQLAMMINSKIKFKASSESTSFNLILSLK